MPAGRPPMFEDPEQMQEGIDAYFESLTGTENKPTISGLCYFLGFVDRGALAEYEKKPEFSRTVKGARIRVEQALEQHLYGGQVTGVIFNLKNNFGWKDKSEQEISGAGGGPVFLWGAQKSD